MNKSEDLKVSKQGLETIQIIVWMLIVVMFTSSITVSTLSILRVSNPLAKATSVVIVISLVSIAVFLKNIRILQLLFTLSICVMALAYTG